ncbi:3-hydroxyacyl-ACP dehydratase FabZ family protein [Amycolatopsis cihanbeyliensis]|uniref:3-hydroxyacyl-[acyl-carrier-protein] dehydratase n=1 Tax=Amycolatopsis cihanbeyliensis TaxID=1128664 RepID=A0A542DE68_AMYCI|nr:beta-hydroxyacyl-ACP dehydratase [Amycolatopsis cihanbeyliensis]TQJ01371.1 3-hydroxyacyl-[acyl-carrier-protein] dehydratase [Amycolatopsis cihanbeyliensis]
MITAAEVRKLLPHRYPMLLVDKVLDVVPGERLTAIKAVTCNEPWYAHAGEDARVEDLAYPETLLLESWGQSAGILAGMGRAEVQSGEVMLFGSMSEVDIHRKLYPGDVAEHRVRVTRALSDTVIFEGESLLEGEPLLTVSKMVMTFRPAEVLRSAEPVTMS